MKISVLRIFVLAGFSTVAAGQSIQTVTLVPPKSPATRKYNEGKSCFNFKLGSLKQDVLKTTGKNDWDLGFGFLSINGQDLFTVHTGSRSVIEDLGKRNWNHPGTVPVLEPLPPLAKGKRRQVTIDTSGDSHQSWVPISSQPWHSDPRRPDRGAPPGITGGPQDEAERRHEELNRDTPLGLSGNTIARITPAHIYSRIIPGHMYALHVKNDLDDFYVQFHVDQFEQDKSCTISWRIVPPPAGKHARKADAIGIQRQNAGTAPEIAQSQ